MSATQNRPQGADEERETQQSQESQMPPVPDGDSPHDVPDENVIEKTLPSKPGAARDRR